MKKFYLLVLTAVITIHAKGQSCSDLFISEYIEGSSHNKAIEIFNPTSGSVDLSHYKLQTFFNGADSSQNIMTLSGTLAANDVWIGCSGQADSSILDSANATNSFVINWTGNDAVALINTATSDTLDIIGIIGVDPGNYWDVTGGTTQDHTLVRNADVQEGTTDWSVGATQWTVYAQNDFSHLGAHTMNPCTITNPSLFFTSDTLSVLESAETFSVSVGIINPNANNTSVDISVNGGSATMEDDYSFASPQTITFPANSSDPILIDGTLVSDAISEPDETIDLSLSNPTNGALITGGAMKVTIIDDDGLGIAHTNDDGISLYPAIGNGIIHISTANLCNLHVLDVWGNEVRTITAVSGNFKLNLQNTAKGFYFLQFENGDRVEVKKVIVN